MKRIVGGFGIAAALALTLQLQTKSVELPAEAPPPDVVLAVVGLEIGLPAAEASERRVGQIVSTNAASKNNSNTAAPFTIRPTGQTALLKARVQCDVAAYVASAGCVDNTCAAVATDTQLAAGQIYGIDLTQNENHIATLCVSAASCTCQVRLLYP